MLYRKELISKIFVELFFVDTFNQEFELQTKQWFLSEVDCTFRYTTIHQEFVHLLEQHVEASFIVAGVTLKPAYA